MINVVWTDDSSIIGPSQEAGTDFTPHITPLLIPSAATTSAVTVKDISYDKSVAASTLLGARVTSSPDSIPVLVSTDTPSVCTVAEGTVTPLATGTAGILMAGKTGVRRYEQAVSLTPGESSKTTTGYTTGSLAKHIHDAVAAMISGKTASATTKELFSAAGYSLASPSATRNSSLFSGSLDLSAICFARDLDHSQWEYYCFPCVLIAPQIVVFAWHARVGNGTQITFMRPNGTFQTVTAGEPVNVGGSNYDIGIAKLSAAITGITPMATLPAGYEQKLPCMSAAPEQPASSVGLQLPALFKGARLADYTFANRLDILPLSKLYGGSCVNFPPFNGTFLSQFQPWADGVVGGDSSGPTMLPINGEPVLVCCQYSTGGGTSIPYFRAAIEAAATTLMGSAVTLRTANLSSFTTY